MFPEFTFLLNKIQWVHVDQDERYLSLVHDNRLYRLDTERLEWTECDRVPVPSCQLDDRTFVATHTLTPGTPLVPTLMEIMSFNPPFVIRTPLDDPNTAPPHVIAALNVHHSKIYAILYESPHVDRLGHGATSIVLVDPQRNE